jgi:hypothetical protein
MGGEREREREDVTGPLRCTPPYSGLSSSICAGSSPCRSSPRSSPMPRSLLQTNMCSGSEAGSQTFVSLNSRHERNKEEEEAAGGSVAGEGPMSELSKILSNAQVPPRSRNRCMRWRALCWGHCVGGFVGEGGRERDRQREWVKGGRERERESSPCRSSRRSSPMLRSLRPLRRQVVTSSCSPYLFLSSLELGDTQVFEP